MAALASALARSLLLAFAPLPRAPLDDSTRPPRDWSQPHGNAANTSACDVEPLRGTPKEAWRKKFAAVLAGPVVSGSQVVAIVREGGDRRIVALDAATGKLTAGSSLDRGGDQIALAVETASIGVLDGGQLRLFRLFDDLIKAQKTLKGDWSDDPLGFDGRLWLRSTDSRGTPGFNAVDPGAGKIVDFFASGSARPALLHSKIGGQVKTSRIELGEKGALELVDDELGGKDAIQRGKLKGYTNGGRILEGHGMLVIVGFRRDDVFYCYVWFPDVKAAAVAHKHAFALPPAVYDRFFVGFDADGLLIQSDPRDQIALGLVNADSMPAGAARGAPSVARDVLYLGNWAVELGSRRVLWCEPSLAPVGPAIPAGDGIVVVRTKESELVGLVDANRTTGTTASEARKERRELPSEDAALAERLGGDETAVYDAFHEAFVTERFDAGRAAFDRFASFRLYDECQRVLATMKEWGLETSRADELERRVAGKISSTAANAPLQRKNAQQEERVACEKLAGRMRESAEWCAARKMIYAASALARRAGEIVPPRPGDLERVLEWVPPEFPRSMPDAKVTTAWMEWADALLPSGARFVARDDPAWKAVKGTAFERDSLALRTPDLLLFTREDSPAIVGDCLSHGEAAVRTLGRILPDVGPKPSDAPLEIRLHRTRTEYLADKIGGVAQPDPWSAGVYSLGEGVSRFYAHFDVDRMDPLGRALHAVLAHELTHHYIDRRWIRCNVPSLPGYWLCEGFAEFVAEQAVDRVRGAATLDETSVISLDIAAAMARRQKLLPLDYLLGLTIVAFHSDFGGDKPERIELRHSLKKAAVDRRGLFYEESAALVFFAMNRCGEAGRKGCLELLEAYYHNRPISDPCAKLGFADFASLEKGFTEFLGGL